MSWCPVGEDRSEWAGWPGVPLPASAWHGLPLPAPLLCTCRRRQNRISSGSFVLKPGSKSWPWGSSSIRAPTFAMAGMSWTSSWSSVGESSRRLLSSGCVCVCARSGLWCHKVADARSPGVGRHSLCSGHSGKVQGWDFPRGWTTGDPPGGECRPRRCAWLPGAAAAAPGSLFSAWLVPNARVPAGPGQGGVLERWAKRRHRVQLSGSSEKTLTIFSTLIIETCVLTTERFMICKFMSVRRHKIESHYNADKSFLWKLIY